MKRFMAIAAVMLFLCGCQNSQSEINRALSVRQALTGSNGCSFTAVITADYSDATYVFTMECIFDSSGAMCFTVMEPESIEGITGEVSQSGGKLTFDEQALAFELIADGQVTPVSAPWLLIKTLRGGYIASCCEDADGIRITIDDSYAEGALQVDIWTDGQDLPSYCEILWDGRRILSLQVGNFSYL